MIALPPTANANAVALGARASPVSDRARERRPHSAPDVMPIKAMVLCLSCNGGEPTTSDSNNGTNHLGDTEHAGSDRQQQLPRPPFRIELVLLRLVGKTFTLAKWPQVNALGAGLGMHAISTSALTLPPVFGAAGEHSSSTSQLPGRASTTHARTPVSRSFPPTRLSSVLGDPDRITPSQSLQLTSQTRIRLFASVSHLIVILDISPSSRTTDRRGVLFEQVMSHFRALWVSLVAAADDTNVATYLSVLADTGSTESPLQYLARVRIAPSEVTSLPVDAGHQLLLAAPMSASASPPRTTAIDPLALQREEQYWRIVNKLTRILAAQEPHPSSSHHRSHGHAAPDAPQATVAAGAQGNSGRQHTPAATTTKPTDLVHLLAVCQHVARIAAPPLTKRGDLGVAPAFPPSWPPTAILLITDGVVTAPTRAMPEVAALAAAATPVHVLLVAPAGAARFGHVAETERLMHVAIATGGRWLNGPPTAEAILVRDVALVQRDEALSDGSMQPASNPTSDRSGAAATAARQFVYNFTPPSHAHLVFPWDPAGAAVGRPLPVACVPTRFRDYDILAPLLVIAARLRQGFHVQVVSYQHGASAATAAAAGSANQHGRSGNPAGLRMQTPLQESNRFGNSNVPLGGTAAGTAAASGSRGVVVVYLLKHWLPYVAIQYRVRARADWSAGRVEVNILAYSEFTVDLFRQTGSGVGSQGSDGRGSNSSPASSLSQPAIAAMSHGAIGANTSAPRSDVAQFNEFLKLIVDQDLVHRVVTEVAFKVDRVGMTPGGSTSAPPPGVGSGGTASSISAQRAVAATATGDPNSAPFAQQQPPTPALATFSTISPPTPTLSREAIGTFAQLVESLLKSHHDWMDTETVDLSASEPDVAFDIKANWAMFEVGGAPVTNAGTPGSMLSGRWFVRLVAAGSPSNAFTQSLNTTGGGGSSGTTSGGGNSGSAHPASRAKSTVSAGLVDAAQGPLSFVAVACFESSPHRSSWRCMYYNVAPAHFVCAQVAPQTPNGSGGGGPGTRSGNVGGSSSNNGLNMLGFGLKSPGGPMSVPILLPAAFALQNRYCGPISIVPGPNADLNRRLLKHKPYVYRVSPELVQRMTALTVQHHTQQGYSIVDASRGRLLLAKAALQCAISFGDETHLAIEKYQLPGGPDSAADSRELNEKLSAMYTIDCLMRGNIPSRALATHSSSNNGGGGGGGGGGGSMRMRGSPASYSPDLFSLRHVLTHSKMTVMGLSLAVGIPIASFARTFTRHLAASCVPLVCDFDHDNVHHAVHDNAGVDPPITDFDCLLYVTTTVLLFFLPRDTRVSYIIVYECLVDQMSYNVWDSVPLSPHSRTRFGQVVPYQLPLVSAFYWTDYHVQTQDTETSLAQFAWPALVECVYSLCHQLHPRDVGLCIESLHEVTASLDVTRLLMVFELLRQHGLGERVSESVKRFSKRLEAFIRPIPDTAYFTLTQPFYFCSMLFVQPDANPRRITALPSLPTPPTLLASLLDSNPRYAATLMAPLALEIQFCFFSLERDAPALTSVIDLHMAGLNIFIRGLITELLLHLTPVTTDRLTLILKDLGTLSRQTLPLVLLKPAPVAIVNHELERADYGDYHCQRIDHFFYLVPKRVLPRPDLAAVEPPRGGAASNSAPASRASSIVDFDVGDLEEGLGIVLPPSHTSYDSLPPAVPNPTVGTSGSQLPPQETGPSLEPMREWIVFMAESSAIHLHTHNPDVVARFHSIAARVAHNVNARMLLNELRSTHTASKYLITPDSPEPREKESRKGRMQIGQFACPVQFSHTIVLHWRLKPLMAINAVSAMLNSLAVGNRRNTFVMCPPAPSESVYYMTLAEVMPTSAAATGNAGGSTGTTVPGTPLMSGTMAGTSNGGLGPSSHLTLPHSMMGDGDDASSATSPSAPGDTQRRLIVQLHGLDEPDRSFTSEVVGMLTSRLSNVILNQISTHLSRTSLSLTRLTRADVEFLLPVARGPRATYPLPLATAAGKADISPKYLSYFRQSLLLFTTILGGPDVSQVLGQHLQLHADVIDGAPPPTSATGIQQALGSLLQQQQQQQQQQSPGGRSGRSSMDNLASLPSGDLYPGEMAFLYCSVTSRTPSSFEQSIGQGVGCICLFLSRDGKILLQSPDSLDRVEWRVELWTHGNVQPEALMHHVRQAHEQAVLDVAMDDAVAHRQFDDVLWKLARSSDDATGPSSNISGNGNSSGLPLGHQHHPCLHTAALPLRLPPWKVKELVDAVQQAIPKGFAPALPTETAMLQQGPVCRRVQQPIWVVSVTPSTPAADGGFYPTFTHYYLKGDKLTRVNVTRHTCLSVHVQQRPVAAVHLVGWNVKAATFQAIQSAVAAFADAVTLQSQTLSRVTLAKQGYTDRRIQSFPILGSQLEITHPSTPSSSGGVDSGGGGPLPQLRLGSVIGDVVFDRPMLTTATGNETGTESTPSLPALSSDQIATMCPADRHIAAYQAFVIAYDQLSKRAEYFVNIYHRWRTLHQRHIRRESESFSPGARDPTSPTALTTRADSAVTDGDLKHVLRFARLIHWCRTPLMFHARVVDQFSLQPAQVAQTPASRDYFATLIPDMFHRYCAYLTTLGLTMISTQAGKDYFSIGPDLTIPADRAFLQKSFQGGILLVEVSVKHIFLAVNLYTVNRRYGPHNGRLPSPGFNAPDYSRQSFRLFAQECSKFKNLVHVNSFVFDYHLHVARSLITASVVTHWGSVIEVLRALMNHFPPAGYSKCRLFHGSVGEPRSALVSYLFSHPVRYRLGLMVQSNAFFLHLQAEPGSSLEYLTVLRQVPVGIEYFVLETPVPTHLHHHRHSSSTSTDGSSSSPSHRRHHHHRRHDDQVYFPHVSRKRTAAASDQQQQQSWSPPEAQRIQDLTQATIQDLVARAETDHTRDKQWQSLLDDDHRGDTRAWLATAREFYCVSIVALDPSVQTLLSMPADWEAIASALEASWSWGVRVLGDAPPPRPAGLRCFLNANNSAMYLLSLHPPHVNVVIRDDREQETGAAVEIFVRSLGRAVWRYLASSVADL